MTDAGRAQDQGRPHRTRRSPSPATASLLARYQQSMRDELAALLQELGGTPPAPGLLDGPDQPDAIRIRIRPPLAERARLWSLAIQLGRELGTEVDASPTPAGPPALPRPRRARTVDFG